MVPTLHMKKFFRGSGVPPQAVSRASCPGAVLYSLLALSLSTLADIPKKAPLVKYTGLWTNSPFTSKPPVVDGPAAVNPLDDFTLTGIAPVPGGYRITIISKKDPTQKKVIEPGGNNEFTLVSVNRDPDKLLGTSVVLSTGAMQGTVTFEPELVTLNVAPAAAPQGQQNLPPGVVPDPNQQANGQAQQANGQAQQANGQAPQRQPRPRIVPPPAPAGTTPAQPAQQQNRSERSNRRR